MCRSGTRLAFNFDFKQFFKYIYLIDDTGNKHYGSTRDKENLSTVNRTCDNVQHVGSTIPMCFVRRSLPPTVLACLSHLLVPFGFRYPVAPRAH